MTDSERIKVTQGSEHWIVALLDRYGMAGVITLILLAGSSWAITYWQTEPGSTVKVLWGLAEYTKSTGSDGGGDRRPGEPDPLARPEDGRRGVLIDLSHGQEAWPWFDKKDSLFSIVEETNRGRLLPDLSDQVEIEAIRTSPQFMNENLDAWSGLILALPRESHIDFETRKVVDSWVRRGHRLVMLGFQQADYHHGSNLNTLASHFGLYFNGDVAVPADWQRSDDPYGVQIDFASEELPSHRLFTDVDRLILRNSSTVTLIPSSEVSVRLGARRWARLGDEWAAYKDGRSIAGREVFEWGEAAPWQAVIAQAPDGLAGEGGVIAVGTWQILTNDIQNLGNRAFVQNLILWAAGVETLPSVSSR